jgi:hypothetical protein
VSNRRGSNGRKVKREGSGAVAGEVEVVRGRPKPTGGVRGREAVRSYTGIL